MNEQQTKNPLLPAVITSLCELSADNKEPREALKYVKIENKNGKIMAIATDAHILGILTLNVQNYEEYPVAPNSNGDEPVTWESILLHKDTVKALERTVPKKSTLPVMNNTLACIDKIADNHIVLRNTDLEKGNIQIQKVFEGNFPPHEQVRPEGEPVFTINIGVPVLEKIVKTLKKLEIGSAKFEFFGSNSVVRITTKTEVGLGGEIELLAMPYKSNE